MAPVPSNKRVCVIVHRVDNGGGQERSTLEVLKRLARRGWSVEIYSFSLKDWPADLPVLHHRIWGENLIPIMLRLAWFQWKTLLPMRKYRLQNPKVPILTIGTASLIADVRVIQFQNRVYFKKIWQGVASMPNPKSPFHTLYQVGFLLWECLLEKILFPRTRGFVAISQTVARDIFPSDSKVEVIHHAVDRNEAFDIGQRPKDNPVVKILFVGALERKGISKVLDCLAGVINLSWECDVLGSGFSEKWKARAQELKLGERVRFHGMKPSADFFAKADILLFPSTYEPFGLVVSEAISWGCIPLASNECGAMELWSERPDWLNISAGEPDKKWIEALARLISSEEKRQEILLSAHSAFSKWSWDLATDAYERVLTDLSSTAQK